MSIRLDPRHLGTLRTLASEAGVRPGELVTLWVTERLDAERRGAPSPGDISAVLESLNDRIESLSRRVDALSAGGGKTRAETPVAEAPKAETPRAEAAPATQPAEAAPKRRGRPPKTTAATNGVKARPTRKPARTRGKNPAVPLHDEIAAVLAERGPMTAADLASTITERAVYAPPRSGKPLDATAVSVRVSNPRYRSRFTRSNGMIGLAS